MRCWTEWTANNLAYHYFACPEDWNFSDYPIEVDATLGGNSVVPEGLKYNL